MSSRKIGTIVYSDGTQSELRLTKSGKVVFKPIKKSLWNIVKQLLSWERES
jgi:hypothetical protein